MSEISLSPISDVNVSRQTPDSQALSPISAVNVSRQTPDSKALSPISAVNVSRQTPESRALSPISAVNISRQTPESRALSPISAVKISQRTLDSKTPDAKASPTRSEFSLDTDKLNRTQDTEERHINLHLQRAREIDPITDDEQSTFSSPTYTETWDAYSSPRKTGMQSQLSTHRSRESGRLSPSLDQSNVEVGKQPLQLPRFNEPLKLRKGRHFVDYEAPAPTVVYVPHRKFAHGRWTNVAVEHKNGRYVVIEQRPIHTQFTDMSQSVKHQYQRDMFGPDTSWVKKKSPWSWASKGNYIERSVNRGFYEPYLPPMKTRYSHVGSRIGSMDNYEHIPGGGTHKVPNFKLKWDAEAKVGSLPNTYREENSPVSTKTLKLPDISPRFGASATAGSFTSIHYTPGGNVILRKQKFDVKSQVGSLDNISHSPGGGEVTLPKKKIKWKKESRIGSLDNVTHLPKSSNVQIFKEKLDWKNEAKVGSMDNAYHTPRKGKFKVPSFPKDWTKTASSKVNSMNNADHYPGGGNVQIIDQKMKWKGKAKVDTKWKFNYDYQSLFGEGDEIDVHSYSYATSQPFTM